MELQTAMWHNVSRCDPTQIATVRGIWGTCPRIFSTAIQNRLVHKSNKIEIPIDGRLQHGTRGRHAYPQEWHFEWMTWFRALVMHCSEPGTAQMAIFVYLPTTQELQLYSNLRRMSDGPFARRLSDQPQQLFVIAERLIMLKSDGVYGGTSEGDRPMPEKVAVY